MDFSLNFEVPAEGGAGGGGAGPYSSPSLSPSLPIPPRDRRFARSPSPYRMPPGLSAAGMYRSHSPLESTAARRLAAEPAPNIFRIVQEEQREVARREARNRELRRLRAVIPNAYEEGGVVVIPPAAQIMGAPVPIRAAAAPAQPVLPPIRPAAAVSVPAAAAASPETNNPRHVNNNNNINPQPRRNHRRRTQRQQGSRKRSRRNSRH